MTGSRPSSRPQSVAAALQDPTIRKVASNFYSKAALLAVSSRVSLPQCVDRNEVKIDKWFGVIADDSDLLRDEIAPWTSLGTSHTSPAPLFIEIYLDPTELSRRDTIVVEDDRGGVHDAVELMNRTMNASRPYTSRDAPIVLERWKIDLVDDAVAIREGQQESIATVYKKAVVLFRSLYTLARLLPAWNLSCRLAKEPTTLRSLRPTFRVLRDDPARTTSRDPLSVPFFTSAEPTVDRQVFDPISTPAGSMSVEVSFRRACDFRIDDAETFISRQLMGEDGHIDSSGVHDHDDSKLGQTSAGREPGSLPSNRRPPLGVLGQEQTYGSMSTFHRSGGQTGTSPMSALRAAAQLNVESPTQEYQRKLPAEAATSSSPRAMVPVPPSVPRRVSVSFQPFKAGSLASSPGRLAVTPTSPRPPSLEAPQSPGSAPSTRDVPAGSTQGPTLKPSIVPDVAAGSPTSTSPKAPPISRYSSSFGHRRSRLSSGGGSSKMDDGGNSSGRGSQSSSNQPGSGLLAEGEMSEAGLNETDDTQISDFLKLLESKKELRSFNKSDEASKEAAARRTAAALNRYRGMRDSHAALSDSMSSSILGQSPGPSPSSRLGQPSSVPPMLAGASVSTSSSPGKPISPHTPHTPAVPSRLSAQANYDDLEQAGQRSRREHARSAEAGGRGTGAIDIPTSPQRYMHLRRPSSAAGQHRALDDEYGMRTSTSVPLGFDGHEGAELSLSELFALNDGPSALAAAAAAAAAARQAGTESEHRNKDSDDQGSGLASGSAHEPEGERPAPFFRPRLRRGGAAGRGSTSSTGTGGSGGERSSRFSWSNRPGAGGADDDEPLVFTMSDMGNRRSTEEGAESNEGNGGQRQRSQWP